jgi:hypothetical protein
MIFSVIQNRRIIAIVLATVAIASGGCLLWVLESPVMTLYVDDSDLLVVDDVFSFGIFSGFTIYRFGAVDLDHGRHRFVGYGLLPAKRYHGYPFSSGGSRVFVAGFGGRIFELSRANGKLVTEPLLKLARFSEFCVAGDTVVWRDGSSLPFYEVSRIPDGTSKTFKPGGISLFLVGCSDERALFDTPLPDGSRALQEVSFTTNSPPETVATSSQGRLIVGDVNWPSGELIYRAGGTRYFFSSQLAERIEMPPGKNIYIGRNHLYLCSGANPCNIEVRDKRTLEVVEEYSIPGACVYLFEM